MKRSKLLPIAVGVLGSALGLAVIAAPGYTWSWGSADQENYEFNPEHRAEILEYGAQYGANWSAEIRDRALASQDGAVDQAHADDAANPPRTDTVDAPRVDD